MIFKKALNERSNATKDSHKCQKPDNRPFARNTQLDPEPVL
jgi:hypothetical protein